MGLRCIVCDDHAPHRCKGCSSVHYCSSECQSIDWAVNHRGECKAADVGDLIQARTVAKRRFEEIDAVPSSTPLKPGDAAKRKRITPEQTRMVNRGLGKLFREEKAREAETKSIMEDSAGLMFSMLRNLGANEPQLNNIAQRTAGIRDAAAQLSGAFLESSGTTAEKSNRIATLMSTIIDESVKLQTDVSVSMGQKPLTPEQETDATADFLAQSLVDMARNMCDCSQSTPVPGSASKAGDGAQRMDIGEVIIDSTPLGVANFTSSVSELTDKDAMNEWGLITREMESIIAQAAKTSDADPEKWMPGVVARKFIERGTALPVRIALSGGRLITGTLAAISAGVTPYVLMRRNLPDVDGLLQEAAANNLAVQSALDQNRELIGKALGTVQGMANNSLYESVNPNFLNLVLRSDISIGESVANWTAYLNALKSSIGNNLQRQALDLAIRSVGPTSTGEDIASAVAGLERTFGVESARGIIESIRSGTASVANDLMAVNANNIEVIDTLQRQLPLIEQAREGFALLRSQAPVSAAILNKLSATFGTGVSDFIYAIFLSHWHGLEIIMSNGFLRFLEAQSTTSSFFSFQTVKNVMISAGTTSVNIFSAAVSGSINFGIIGLTFKAAEITTGWLRSALRDYREIIERQKRSLLPKELRRAVDAMNIHVDDASWFWSMLDTGLGYMEIGFGRLAALSALIKTIANIKAIVTSLIGVALTTVMGYLSYIGIAVAVAVTVIGIVRLLFGVNILSITYNYMWRHRDRMMTVLLATIAIRGLVARGFNISKYNLPFLAPSTPSADNSTLVSIVGQAGPGVTALGTSVLRRTQEFAALTAESMT